MATSGPTTPTPGRIAPIPVLQTLGSASGLVCGPDGCAPVQPAAEDEDAEPSSESAALDSDESAHGDIDADGSTPRTIDADGSTPADSCAPAPGTPFGAPLPAHEAERLARRLKAVADPARLRLLSLVLASPGGQACTCHLTEPLGLSQPTVSHHLRTLVEAGLMSAQRRGVWTYYHVRQEALSELAATVAHPLVTPTR